MLQKQHCARQHQHLTYINSTLRYLTTITAAPLPKILCNWFSNAPQTLFNVLATSKG
jgi:hypothetical protein